MSDSIPLGLPTPRTTLRARYVALLVWCKACRHQAEADLQALVDAGKCHRRVNSRQIGRLKNRHFDT